MGGFCSARLCSTKWLEIVSHCHVSTQKKSRVQLEQSKPLSICISISDLCREWWSHVWADGAGVHQGRASGPAKMVPHASRRSPPRPQLPGAGLTADSREWLPCCRGRTPTPPGRNFPSAVYEGRSEPCRCWSVMAAHAILILCIRLGIRYLPKNIGVVCMLLQRSMDAGSLVAVKFYYCVLACMCGASELLCIADCASSS